MAGLGDERTRGSRATEGARGCRQAASDCDKIASIGVIRASLPNTHSLVTQEMAIERTLCIIKPDAVRAGNTGNIIAHIQKEGFKILGLKMVALSNKAAGKFYEVHKERPFYGGLCQFMSGGAGQTLTPEKQKSITGRRRVV